jgi:hypothetical protein
MVLNKGVQMRKISYLLAATILVGSVLIPQSAMAASSADHPRVAPLVASNNYAVYKQKTTGGTISGNQLTGGSVYAVDKNGKRQSLPGFTNEKRFMYLTGDFLVQATNTIHNTVSDHQTVRYLNLRTGAHGTATYPVGGAGLVAAAPDGWIMDQATDVDTGYGTLFDLVVVHPDGTTRNLGTPFNDGRSFSIAVSDYGIISTPGISDESAAPSQVRRLTWSSSSTWSTLYTTKGGPDTGITCMPSSSTYTACSLVSADFNVKSGLVSLSGQGARWIQDKHPGACKYIDYVTKGGSLFAIETSNLGVCTKGKLYRFNFAGKLVSNGSSHLYSSEAGIVAGLGKVLVSSVNQRHLDTLSNLPQNPNVLVKV